MSVAASVEPPVIGVQEDPREHLDGAAAWRRARDDAERRDELVSSST